MAFGDLPKEPQACIGGARFIVTGPGIAEASLTVRDDFQGQGIGTELLRLLIVEAQKSRRPHAGGRRPGLESVRVPHASPPRSRGQSSTHAGETHLEIDLGEVSLDETLREDDHPAPELSS